MENRNYSINRDEIYAGELVRANCDLLTLELTNLHPEKLEASAYYPLRSMLFVPTEEGYSNDLLYNSPSYPVLNITDDAICKNLGESALIINGAINLGPLLAYLGFKSDMDFSDVSRVRRPIFNQFWVLDNVQLFGNDLPMEYWHALMKFGDKSLLEVLFKLSPRMNAFKPAKEEGPIRKLKRF